MAGREGGECSGILSRKGRVGEGSLLKTDLELLSLEAPLGWWWCNAVLNYSVVLSTPWHDAHHSHIRG